MQLAYQDDPDQEAVLLVGDTIGYLRRLVSDKEDNAQLVKIMNSLFTRATDDNSTPWKSLLRVVGTAKKEAK